MPRKRPKEADKAFKTHRNREKVTADQLKDLDLDHELLNQYKDAKEMLEDALDDTETPLNQKAQLINSITNILKQVIELQEKLHNIENMKLLESVLIETLQKYPEVSAEFLRDYEKALKNAS